MYKLLKHKLDRPLDSPVDTHGSILSHSEQVLCIIIQHLFCLHFVDTIYKLGKQIFSPFIVVNVFQI